MQFVFVQSDPIVFSSFVNTNRSVLARSNNIGRSSFIFRKIENKRYFNLYIFVLK